MAIVAHRPLKTNSTDVVNGRNGTDTSIDYAEVGPFLGAATYNDSGDRITVANHSSFNITTGSISMRVNTSLSSSYAYLMCKNDNTAQGDNFCRAFGFSGVTTLGKQAFYNGGRRASNTSIAGSKRHRVTVASNSSGADFYIDGKNDGSPAYNMFIATGTASSLYIGNRYLDSRNFSGYISHVTFFNNKLTPAEEKNYWAFDTGLF